MNKGRNICTTCKKRTSNSLICYICRIRDDYKSPYKEVGTGRNEIVGVINKK